MKTCYECDTPKPNDAFPLRSKVTGKRFNKCKECQREYSKQHYREHREQHNRRRYTNQLRYRERNSAFLDAYLAARQCVDCGETGIEVLCFDHITGEKSFNLSDARSMGISIEKIEAEITKCEVRCLNCHARRHAREFV